MEVCLLVSQSGCWDAASMEQPLGVHQEVVLAMTPLVPAAFDGSTQPEIRLWNLTAGLANIPTGETCPLL